MSIISKLSELEKQLTKGPWINGNASPMNILCGAGIVASVYTTADAIAIVKFRNAMPKLMDLYRAVKQLRATSNLATYKEAHFGLDRVLAALEEEE